MASSSAVDLAIQKLSETRGLLQQLIVSSESFDYPKAKLALEDLKRKIMELERMQRRLQSERQREQTGSETVIPFPSISAGAKV